MNGDDELKATYGDPHSGPHGDGGDEFDNGGQDGAGDALRDDLRDDVAARRPAGGAGDAGDPTSDPSGEPIRAPNADPATAHADPAHENATTHDGTGLAHDDAIPRDRGATGDRARAGARPAHDGAIVRDGDEPAGADRTPPYGDEPVRSEAGADRIPPYDDDPARAPYADPAPAHAAPGDIVLFDQDTIQVQTRWRDLQASFVDDPGEAVRRADGLVGEVVESLTSSLTSRTEALRGRWKDAGEAETEQLRLALRDYRNVLERLLALSGSPDPQQADEPRHSVLGSR